MKKLVALFSFCLASTCVSASDTTGVTFLAGPWQQVLSEAQRLNKPIFVDMYTTWCGPCVKMAKEAFPNAKVGQLFNTNFVNYQIDAEKGEGIVMAKTYQVTAYPTLLFVSPTGEVIYRTEGYGGVEQLLAEASKVIEVTGNLSHLWVGTHDYKGNLRDKAYLKEYLKNLAKLKQPAGNLLDEYVKNLPQAEWTTSENLAIMAGTLSSTNSKAFDILLEQLPAIRSSEVGKEALITMPMAVASDFKKVIDTKDEKALESLIAKNKKLVEQAGVLAPELVDQELLQQRIDFYRQTKNYEKYHLLASFYVQTQLLSQSIDSLRQQDERTYQEFQRRINTSDSVRQTMQFARLNEAMKHRASEAVADKLNTVARSYFESLISLKHLREAMLWAKRAVELHTMPTYLETYACLLYRLNRTEEAIKEQTRAVAKAKELNTSQQELEEVLDKMKKGSL